MNYTAKSVTYTFTEPTGERLQELYKNAVQDLNLEGQNQTPETLHILEAQKLTNMFANVKKTFPELHGFSFAELHTGKIGIALAYQHKREELLSSEIA